MRSLVVAVFLTAQVALAFQRPAALLSQRRAALQPLRVKEQESPPAAGEDRAAAGESSGTMISTEAPQQESKLPVWIDPGTNGGVIGLSVIGITVPILVYNLAVGVFKVNPDQAGSAIGVGFTVLSVIVWTSTYIWRVATKDMTYAKQLRDYENAVLQKRLEELEEDEVEALMDEIDDEDKRL